MRTASLDAGRFKRLGVRSDDTWQGGLVRLPSWIPAQGLGAPYRLRGAFWRSTRTGLYWIVPETDPHSADTALAVRALVEFAHRHERELLGRPQRLEVTNAAFADELRALLDGETDVAVLEDLPGVREALKVLAQSEEVEADTLSLLDEPDLTIDDVRRFADASAAFFRAAPWEALGRDDVVTVSAPGLPDDVRAVLVVGSHLDTRGLLAFASAEDAATVADVGGVPSAIPWAVPFGSIDEMTFGDADLWTDQALAAPAADAYPRPGRLSGDAYMRPDAATLDALALILRALAESTPEDFDSGRWTRTVKTGLREDTLTLSLPRLLEAIAREAEAPGPSEHDDRAAANTLAAAARRESGRARVRLARMALTRSRDCAEAWTILADNTDDMPRAVPLYREAIAAAERMLGPDVFERHGGRFWAIDETRPYMVARRGLAECLDAAGNFGEAITHYDALLTLNPSDDQLVRRSYVIALLDAGRVTDALALVDRFASDDSPAWLLAGALVLFRCEGGSDAAHMRMDRALERNRHLAAVLAGTRDVPEMSPGMTEVIPGSVEEAARAVLWQLDAWEETPGAIEWMLARYRQRGRTRR